MGFTDNTTEGFGTVGRVGLGAGDLPVRVRLHGHHATYHLRAERTLNGPKLTGLAVAADDGYAIEPGDFRKVPVARLAAAAVEHADGIDLAAPDFAEVFAEPETKPENTRRRGRKPHSPEHYREVAETIRAARSEGRGEYAAVAARWTVATKTAEGWAREARKRGLLERKNKGGNTNGGK